MTTRRRVIVRNTTPDDFAGIIALSEETYPGSPPWSESALASHREQFAEGQFVAIDTQSGSVVGMAASLIVLWDDYEFDDSWRDFTAGGSFRNHDPARGHTLYGAEVMVSPGRRGLGIGKAIYAARFALAERLGLWRIRAGARLRGYHRHAHRLSAREYTERVVRGTSTDATLSFQLRQGFEVLGVVPNYLAYDPESLGYAAVIEWRNPAFSPPPDRDQRYTGVIHRGTMLAQRSAPSGSATPTLDTTTRADVPSAPGTTANSAA